MRKILFWLHLVTGLIAGLMIFVMCVTGALLTVERQTLDWADRHDARVVPMPGAKRLALFDLIAKLGGPPSAVTLRSDPSEPVEVVLGRSTVYVNPYTGAITGQPSKRAHEFFEDLRAWHRWIAISDATHKNTQPIYDAANLLFLFIVLSGPFLWWPKKFTRRHLRPIVWFRGGLSGKARDFNWHNSIGLWTNIPLLIIVATGVVLSYQWANNLLYRITGTQMPKFAAAQKSKEPLNWQGFDMWIARAEAKMPDWRTITVRNAPAPTISLSLDSGTGGQPQKRFNLTLNRATGEEVKWEPFMQNNLGFELRILSRFAHTGEVGGWPLQAVAGIVSLGGAVLVYTGFALSLRRFLAWRRRKARVSAPEAVQVA